MNNSDKIPAVEPTVMEYLKKKARHAGYWEGLSKPEKELHVVNDLLLAIRHHDGREWITKLIPNPLTNEPPDVIGVIGEGSRVAFEVTELVDQSMIERRARGQGVGKDWTCGEVISRLQSKVDDKGRRSFSKKHFASVFLVIHTAERELRASVFGPAISAHRFIRKGQIDEAYLIFPPGPPRFVHRSEPRICPYFRLSFG
jgi:hypothetical protein